MRYKTWESYFYPETYNPATGQGTLRNLYGERDAKALARMEYGDTSARAYDLVHGQVRLPRTYDAAHIRAIHGYLFQDVYEWAGQYRGVNISKNVSTFADVHAGQVDRYLNDVHRLVTGTEWASLDHEEFSRASAEVFAYLNQAHPFREGNGRTSKVFMEHVAELSRFTLDFSRVNPEVWNQASMLSGPDLGRYEPVPDSLVPVFRVIAQPRATGPSNPSADMGRSAVRASYPQVTTEVTRRSSGATQQRLSRRPGRGQGSRGVER
ncbi:cell filamentation protein Fic [Actinomyces sp. Z5]|uniref:Fic/DOC family protein n=2 Tax=Actinomyces TaxID=1654 RepID=UPI000D5A0AED|nr:MULTISPECIES: Fic family protein [unclassified Actinomyces]RAX21790.1 cell filamentation protein Fic [Actinomyces sp. Z5]